MKWILLLTITIGLTACVQTPTQTTSTVDNRPRVAFDEKLPGEPSDYTVFVDGISYGLMSQYLVDEATLRLVEGTHLIEVEGASGVIFSTTVFLGASSTRVIKVVSYE